MSFKIPEALLLALICCLGANLLACAHGGLVDVVPTSAPLCHIPSVLTCHVRAHLHPSFIFNHTCKASHVHAPLCLDQSIPTRCVRTRLPSFSCVIQSLLTCHVRKELHPSFIFNRACKGFSFLTLWEWMWERRNRLPICVSSKASSQAMWENTSAPPVSHPICSHMPRHCRRDLHPFIFNQGCKAMTERRNCLHIFVSS